MLIPFKINITEKNLSGMFLIKRYTNMDDFHKYILKCLFSRDNENLKTIKHTFVNTQSKFDL